MAYFRKKISYEDYERALTKIVGDSGLMLASRLSYAVILGPIFAWYLLARGVNIMVNALAGLEKSATTKVLVKYDAVA